MGVSVHITLAPYVEFGWEMLSGSKIECLLPTNSLPFGISLRRWGKELLNWIRRRQTKTVKGASVAGQKAVAGSNLKQCCCPWGMSYLSNWTYLKICAAFRLNIFFTQAGWLLSIVLPSFVHLALQVFKSCLSNALPPTERTEMTNKTPGITGCLQDHMAPSVCLSLSHLWHGLSGSYLDLFTTISSWHVALLHSFTVPNTASSILILHYRYIHDLFIIMKLVMQDYNGGGIGGAHWRNQTISWYQPAH